MREMLNKSGRTVRMATVTRSLVGDSHFKVMYSICNRKSINFPVVKNLEVLNVDTGDS